MRGRVRDKDGGVREYTKSLAIKNALPKAEAAPVPSETPPAG